MHSLRSRRPAREEQDMWEHIAGALTHFLAGTRKVNHRVTGMSPCACACVCSLMIFVVATGGAAGGKLKSKEYGVVRSSRNRRHPS